MIEDEIAPSTCYCMFEGCLDLTEIEGLENLDTSNVTDMSCMFACFSLESLDLSGWDTSHVTDMYGMFCGCPLLESLNLSGWDTSNVTDMSHMFDGCRLLTEIGGLSSFDTSKVRDMSKMFAYCTSLTSLDLSGWDMGNVTDMSWMLDVCTSLETVTTNAGHLHIVPFHTKVVDPTARANTDATPSLGDTMNQFTANIATLRAAELALQGNVEHMRETFGPDPR